MAPTAPSTPCIAGWRTGPSPAVAIAVQAVLAVAGFVALGWILAGGRAFHLAAEPWEVPLALALNLVAVAIHELGHAVVLTRCGRRVRTIGFRLHLGAPTFYVDSVEGLLIARAASASVQAAAGPWAEWWFTAAVAIAVVVAPAGDLTSVLARFVVANAIGIALNLLPFVGLDGALLLADIVRVPDLRQRAEQTARGAGRRARRRRPGVALRRLHGGERRRGRVVARLGAVLLVPASPVACCWRRGRPDRLAWPRRPWRSG